MSLAQKQRSNLNVDFNSVQSGDRDAGAMRSLDAALTPVDTGTLVVKNEGTSYIDSANWRAILEEVRIDLIIAVL